MLLHPYSAILFLLELRIVFIVAIGRFYYVGRKMARYNELILNENTQLRLKFVLGMVLLEIRLAMVIFITKMKFVTLIKLVM